MRTYRTIDAPEAGPAAQLVVEPMWPLLASMLIGSTVGWAWMVVNAFAMGSPTRGRELGMAVVGLVGNSLGFLGVVLLLGSGVAAPGSAPYLLLGLVTWKLGVTYLLYLEQVRTFPLYQHFGGAAGSGLRLVAVGFVLRRLVPIPGVVAAVCL